MTTKWFDLQSVDAKLERIRSSSGELCVRLTLKEAISPEKMREVAKVGWIPSQEDKAGLEFSNFGKLSRLSHLASMVSAFFPEEVVLNTKTDVTNLKQGEEVTGFDSDSGSEMGIAPVEAIEQNIERLPDNVRKRIMARVNAAQMLMGGERNVSEALFRNDGINLWKQLSSHFGIHEATEAMAGVLYVAQAKGEDLKQQHEALLRAAETGTNLPTITSQAKQYIRELFSNQKILKEIHETVAPGAWSESRFYQSFAKYFRVNYRLWDGAEVDYSHQLDAPDIKGIKFHADPGLPTLWKKDMAFRIADAMRRTANILEVYPSDLLSPTANKIVHLGNITALRNQSQKKAYVRHHSFRNEEGQSMSAQAIKITPFSLGSFVHELGHGIDFNIRNGWGSSASPDILRAILDDTGVRREINEFLDVASRKDWIGDQQLAYFRSAPEMIARSFETALWEHAQKEDDFLNHAGGGVVMCFPGVLFMPTPPTAEKFLDAVKVTLKNVLENRLEAELSDNQTEMSP